MADAVALIHDERFLAYDFGPYHPLRPERLTASIELLREIDLYDPERDTPVFPAVGRRELLLAHDAAYLDAVAAASADPTHGAITPEFGFAGADNPPFAGMHEVSALIAGGTVWAARCIMRGSVRHVFNPGGGWHHATRARAAGFCIYNDAAIAAAALVAEFGARVFYVDFDCHHGDGVQWIFYAEPRVFTLSFHESGRFLFPGTGEPEEVGTGEGLGSCANMPVLPFTEDASWQEAVETLLPPLARRFAPDVIISNHGCDTHALDPIAHLALSTRALQQQAALTHRLAHDLCDGRWLAVGSGGYAWREVVPRSWAIVWSEMSERPLPAELPLAWRVRWAPRDGGSMPDRFLDETSEALRADERAQVEQVNRQTLEAVARATNLVRRRQS